MPRGLRAAIEQRIRELLAGGDERLEWIQPSVRAHGFLPLYLGWLSAIGVRPDGSFVQWDHDVDHATVKPLHDSYWEHMAPCEGAKKHPELAVLIPTRPVEARRCEACAGTGTIAGAPQIICECGGSAGSSPASHGGLTRVTQRPKGSCGLGGRPARRAWGDAAPAHHVISSRMTCHGSDGWLGVGGHERSGGIGTHRR